MIYLWQTFTTQLLCASTPTINILPCLPCIYTLELKLVHIYSRVETSRTAFSVGRPRENKNGGGGQWSWERWGYSVLHAGIGRHCATTKGNCIFFCQLYNYHVGDRYIDRVILIFLSVKAVRTGKSWFLVVCGPSRWNIAKGPFVYSLRQRKKISYALGEERQINNIF